MAFTLKQANFELPATAEQRKVLDLLGVVIETEMTRIQAHLAIKGLLQQDPELKRRLTVWRQAREADRRMRRENAQRR
ncbi:MAG: hypothetical protein SF051_05380 [Elusimicrobiota bacterium]|nr:hypothetical protein [Elusimicrobiota bacterium]